MTWERGPTIHRSKRWSFKLGGYAYFKTNEDLLARGVFYFCCNDVTMFRKMIFYCHGPRNFQRIFITRESVGITRYEGLVSNLFLAPSPFVVESPLVRGDGYIKKFVAYEDVERRFMEGWLGSRGPKVPTKLGERVLAWENPNHMPLSETGLGDNPELAHRYGGPKGGWDDEDVEDVEVKFDGEK